MIDGGCVVDGQELLVSLGPSDIFVTLQQSPFHLFLAPPSPSFDLWMKAAGLIYVIHPFASVPAETAQR